MLVLTSSYKSTNNLRNGAKPLVTVGLSAAFYHNNCEASHVLAQGRGITLTTLTGGLVQQEPPVHCLNSDNRRVSTPATWVVQNVSV